jgi:hypothetical protein
MPNRAVTTLIFATLLLVIALFSAVSDAQPYVPPPIIQAQDSIPGNADVTAENRHEVWVLDQSNTGRSNASALPDHGGRIYIYNGETLRKERTNSSVLQVVELADATTTVS